SLAGDATHLGAAWLGPGAASAATRPSCRRRKAPLATILSNSEPAEMWTRRDRRAAFPAERRLRSAGASSRVPLTGHRSGERPRSVARFQFLRNDGRAERHRRLARASVLRVGEERIVPGLGEMSRVEGIGVGSVGEAVAEAVQGELRRAGSDEVVDRVAVIAGDRGPRRLQARDGDAIGFAGDTGDLIETAGVGLVVGGERPRRRHPLALIAPTPLERFRAPRGEHGAGQEDECELHGNPRRLEPERLKLRFGAGNRRDSAIWFPYEDQAEYRRHGGAPTQARGSASGTN